MSGTTQVSPSPRIELSPKSWMALRRAGCSEEARDISEAWAEGHEEAIERSSDRAGDDLERIYEPAKELARKSVHAAERDNEMRRKRMHRLLESSERVELVQVMESDRRLSAVAR